MKQINAVKTARINFRITSAENEMLLVRAKNERKTVVSLLREIVLNDLRETQRVTAMENHILDFEKRLVNTMKYLTKEIGRLNTTEQVALSALDSFLLTYLAHTPPTQEVDREFLGQEANRRYNAIIKTIHGGLSDGGGLTEVARRSMPEENSDE